MKLLNYLFFALLLNSYLTAQQIDSITQYNRFLIGVNTLPLISDDEASARNTIVFRRSGKTNANYLRALLAVDFKASTEKNPESILLPEAPREIDDAYDITVALGFEKAIRSLAKNRISPYVHLSAYGRRTRINTGSYGFDVNFDNSRKDEFEMNQSQVGLLGGFGLRYQLSKRIRLSTEIHLIGGYEWRDERSLKIERDVVLTDIQTTGRGVFFNFNPLSGIYLEFALGKIRSQNK